MKAERKAGEMLATLQRSQGKRVDLTSGQDGPKPFGKILSENERPPATAKRWQKQGSVERDRFDPEKKAITDEPPEEVAAAGHDRCPIPILEKNIDAWLSPQGRTTEELFALLDERERPYYEHRFAA